MLFQPFDEQAPVRIYYTSMPHWRQDGCTYFVTYRLADSIPKKVVDEWDYEKQKWIQARLKSARYVDSVSNRIPNNNSVENRTYKWHELFAFLCHADKYAFLKCFNRKLNTYLDGCHGACILRNPAFAEVLLEGWKFFDGLRYELGDLVVMPNHVHVLLTPLVGFELEDILRSQKRHGAKECNRLLSLSGPLWLKHSYDHIVRDAKELLAFQGYIARNPEKAKLRHGEFILREHVWELPS